MHDLRGTFVTASLANGKSESWIADRTGHRSSAMINRYKRISRTFEELDLGALAPLRDAIPERVAHLPGRMVGHKVGHEITIQHQRPASQAPYR